MNSRGEGRAVSPGETLGVGIKLPDSHFTHHHDTQLPMQLPLISHKAARFTESVIRGMSIEANRHGAVNLAQGMPDFPAPPEIKAAACRAIEADINQYAITWGAQESAAGDRRACRMVPGPAG